MFLQPTRSKCKLRRVCRRDDIKSLEDPVLNSRVSVAEHPWRRRSLYQDMTASSKVMEVGSIVSAGGRMGKTVQVSYCMLINSMSMCPNTLYMAHMDVGSSLRWLSASIMT